jgi:pimeloyl-ACP methyl ester carboxylesterase
MSTITTKDDTQICYKDWGKGPVVTFSHGWPLNSDAWDSQMIFLAQRGHRCVALDRQGHGRSSQASTGNNTDGFAEDLAAVIEGLDPKEATLVGHSTGGGEVARYVCPAHTDSDICDQFTGAGGPTFARGTTKNGWVDIKNNDMVVVMGGNPAERGA